LADGQAICGKAGIIGGLTVGACVEDGAGAVCLFGVGVDKAGAGVAASLRRACGGGVDLAVDALKTGRTRALIGDCRPE